MDPLLNTAGLLQGLEVLTRNFEDTKLITYLATNSTAGNSLGLKDQSHEFCGNYAHSEIKDTTKISIPDLLKYNLIDCLATNYVYDKNLPIMVEDNQEDIYRNLFLPSAQLIIQLQLTGMPMNPKRVQEVKAELVAIRDNHLKTIQDSPLVLGFNKVLQEHAMVAANAKLKKKQHPIEHFADVTLNPNSGPQLQKLLYGEWDLPVIDLTDTKQPATGADTLGKLINHVTDPDRKSVLEALIGFGEVEKILTSFIPAFERAIDKGQTDIVWLHGSFNLGGTVSGRLSSSDPNLQNLPAKSTYGKLIKSCFMAPKEWLFCGADFNSLEDMISALTTKDPNKLKVYAGSKQFDVTVNGVTHRIREEDVVKYDGKEINGSELYEKLQGSKPRDVRHL